MKGEKLSITGVLAMVAVAVLVFFVMSSNDICSDDVRGYERSAGVSISAARKNLSKIKASLSVDDSQNVGRQLDGLNPTKFAALKACDTQCKLLGRCLRFVIVQSPSAACPAEYADYRARMDAAFKLLADLDRVNRIAQQAAEQAEALGKAKQDLSELENSSGATGGLLALQKAEVRRLQDGIAITMQNLERMTSSLMEN